MANEESPRLLIDTSIWLEYLGDQERADEVEEMLQQVSLPEMAVTEFAIGSIEHILTSVGRAWIFLEFLDNLLRENGVFRIVLSGRQMKRTVEAMDDFDLDFDYAYQYVAATSRELQLVSFDADFDRTDLEHLEPQDVLDVRR